MTTEVSGTIGITASVGGVNVRRTVIRTGSHSNPHIAELDPGTAASLTTRTNDTDGNITLPDGHGLETGTFDIYWDGGQRYGVAGTVTSDDMAITGGDGTNLPTASTAVIVSEQVTVTMCIQGDEVKLAVAMAEYTTTPAAGSRVHADFREDAVSEVQLLFPANEPRVWDVEGGATNPWATEEINNIKISNGSITPVVWQIATIENRIDI